MRLVVSLVLGLCGASAWAMPASYPIVGAERAAVQQYSATQQLHQLDQSPAKQAALRAIVKQLKQTHQQHQLVGQPTLAVVMVPVNKQLQPMYLLKARLVAPHHVPMAYRGLFQVKKPYALYTAWNVNHAFADVGPGGNGNTGEYHYGNDNLPALNVLQQGTQCTMQDAVHPSIQVVDLSKAVTYDQEDQYKAPFVYRCGDDQRDAAFGAYSAADDAYTFGKIVQSMYTDWYHTSVLANGQPLVLRVHYADFNCDDSGQCKRITEPNAFWDDDSQTMNFGDGAADRSIYPPEQRDFIPLMFPMVSPEITGHEISHGYTAKHAGLSNNAQAQSLNESFSDMAAIATEAYLLNTPKYHDLYRDIYHQTTINWEIGKTLPRPGDHPKMLAVRYMNQPSKDGHSADCYLSGDKADAQCHRYYADVVKEAQAFNPNPEDQAVYISHFANGIFNRFFYLLVTDKGWPVKQAFGLALDANNKYWTKGTPKQSDYFDTVASCGLLQAANDLGYSVKDVKSALDQVHVPYVTCHLAGH